MRCASLNLPDYSALRIDSNWGKWNCSIDLKKEKGREKPWILILEVDVVVQAYRPGALDKYGL
jgi:crotonobetainyl-CoA:carnitine CoA-transferase CaiB-like acyl-CoA transferase